MARIRTVKPQHVTDKELPNISLQAHLLWVLSWCFSDDDGVFENDPLLIKSTIFPRRTDVRTEHVEQWLGQLVKARFIVPFTHNGIGYYIHRTFKVHQKIDKPTPSSVPEEVIRRTLSEHSTTDRLPVVSVEYSKVVESKGEVVESTVVPTAPRTSEEFEKFEKWIQENAPQVGKLGSPFTLEEFEKLKKEHPGEAVREILLQMQNKKDLLKKYTSAYLTCLNWLKRASDGKKQSKIDTAVQTNIEVKEYLRKKFENEE